MEIINVNKKKPQSLRNVLVCYKLHHQDFWTRGFLCDDKWTIMLWDKKIEVPFEEIIHWTELPWF
jgi:hypothetical protein